MIRNIARLGPEARPNCRPDTLCLTGVVSRVFGIIAGFFYFAGNFGDLAIGFGIAFTFGVLLRQVVLLGKLVVKFVEGFLAEVPDFQQLALRHHQHFANTVDASALQAVQGSG